MKVKIREADPEKIPAYETEITKSWTKAIEQGLFI